MCQRVTLARQLVFCLSTISAYDYMEDTKMQYEEAKRILDSEPQKRFHVVFPNEKDMAMDEMGFRISMRGFIPTFGIDLAFVIAKKFHGEVA